MHEQRAERVGKALAREPEQLAYAMAQQARLELRREIRVEPLVTLMSVMTQVV